MENDLMYANPTVVEHEERIRRAEQRILDAISLLSGRAQRSASLGFSLSGLMAPRPNVQILVWD